MTAVRVEPDTAWLTIKRPGAEADYIEVADRDVSALVAEFQAIGDDREKFKTRSSAVVA